MRLKLKKILTISLLLSVLLNFLPLIGQKTLLSSLIKEDKDVPVKFFASPSDSIVIKVTVAQKNAPPEIIDIEPKNGSTFFGGSKITIQVTAIDPNADPLEYRFWIGGAIVQNWSGSSSYTWVTTSTDRGDYNILIEVRDDELAQDSETLIYHIISPTAEEILQRISENYSLIQDTKADMTLFSTLNGNPFGDIDYSKFYFKRPDKTRTEGYSSSDRTTMIEIYITNSSTMYIIDPNTNTTQEINLLEEAGISAEQFNQMDILYNQQNFLDNHTISKNDTNSDFENGILAVDVLPNVSNAVYSKLELYIDYNKGLLNKSLLYKDDVLIQTMAITNSQQMANGAWVPTEMTKTALLTAGEFVTTTIFENIQINTGLSDALFEPPNRSLMKRVGKRD